MNIINGRFHFLKDAFPGEAAHLNSNDADTVVQALYQVDRGNVKKNGYRLFHFFQKLIARDDLLSNRAVFIITEAAHRVLNSQVLGKGLLPQLQGANLHYKNVMNGDAGLAAQAANRVIQALIHSFRNGAEVKEACKQVILAPDSLVEEVASSLDASATLPQWRMIKALQRDLKAGDLKQAMLVAFRLPEALLQVVLSEFEASDPDFTTGAPAQARLTELRAEMDTFLKAMKNEGSTFAELVPLLTRCSQEELGGLLLDVAKAVQANYSSAVNAAKLRQFLSLFPNCGKEIHNLVTVMGENEPPKAAVLWSILVHHNPTRVFGGFLLEGDAAPMLVKLGNLPNAGILAVLRYMKALQEKNQKECWAVLAMPRLHPKMILAVNRWAQAFYPADQEMQQLQANTLRYSRWIDALQCPGGYQIFVVKGVYVSGTDYDAIAREIKANMPHLADKVETLRASLKEFADHEERLKIEFKKESPKDLLEYVNSIQNIQLRNFVPLFFSIGKASGHPLMQHLERYYDLQVRIVSAQEQESHEELKKYNVEMKVVCRKIVLAVSLPEALLWCKLLQAFHGADAAESTEHMVADLKRWIELERAIVEKNSKKTAESIAQSENEIDLLFEHLCKHHPELTQAERAALAEKIVKNSVDHFLQHAEAVKTLRADTSEKVKAVRAVNDGDIDARRKDEERLFNVHIAKEAALFEKMIARLEILQGMYQQVRSGVFLLLFQAEKEKTPGRKLLLDELYEMIRFPIDRAHYQKGVVSLAIPNKPAGSHMDEALKLFDSVSFYDATKKPSYDPKALFPEYRRDFQAIAAKGLKKMARKQPELKGLELDAALRLYEKKKLHQFIRDKLKSIINVVTSRNVDFGPRNPEAFYLPYENGFVHIIRKLKENEQGAIAEGLEAVKAVTANTLFAIIRSNGYCYTRMREINLDLYQSVVLKQSTNFEDRIYRELADFRNVLFQSALTPDSYQSIHYLTRAVQELGKMYGIPGAEELLKGGLDNFVMGAQFKASWDILRFEGSYNAAEIVSWIENSLNEKYKQEYKEWWAAHVPYEWSTEEIDEAKKKAATLRAQKKEDDEIGKTIGCDLGVAQTLFYKPEEMIEAAKKKGIVPPAAIAQAEELFYMTREAIDKEKRKQILAHGRDIKKMADLQKEAREKVIQAEKELEKALQVPRSVVRKTDEMIEGLRVATFIEQEIFEATGAKVKRAWVPEFLKALSVFA